MKWKLRMICVSFILCNIFVACNTTQETVQPTTDNTQTSVEQMQAPTATPASQVGGIVVLPAQKEEETEQQNETEEIVESIPKEEYNGTLTEYERAEIEDIIDKVERLTNE